MTVSTVVDVHSHRVMAGFTEQVRKDGSRHGYAVGQAKPGAARAVAGDANLITPDGVSVDLGPQKSDEGIRNAEMGTAGIDLSLESISPGAMSYGATAVQAERGARAINDGLSANMKAFPDLVSRMATVPLQFPELAVREVERVVRDYGMWSVQLATNVNRENLDQPEFDVFWEAAQRLDVLVFVHPRYRVAKHRMSGYHLANLIGSPSRQRSPQRA
jgi:aminocarboxymuconate-semialdehyde decarboxylase